MIFPPSFILLLFPSLLRAVINSSTEAIGIAPQIIAEGSKLKVLIEEYQTIQYVVAAVELRSLIPNYSLVVSRPVESNDKLGKSGINGSKSDYDEDQLDDDEQESDSDDEEPLSRFTIHAASLNVLLKSITEPEDIAQVFTFDFLTHSLPDFIAQKEVEAQNKLLESIPIIRKIQELLKVPNNLPLFVNIKFLAKIVKNIDAIDEEMDEIEENASDTTTKKESKRLKAVKAISESQAKIFKLAQKTTALFSSANEV